MSSDELQQSSKAIQDRIGFALCALVVGLYFTMFAAVFVLSREASSTAGSLVGPSTTSIAAITACMLSCVALTGFFVSSRRSA
ncbi:hypothetical protein ACVWY5_006710 [Bradyrhizobium sp. USDA 3256]